MAGDPSTRAVVPFDDVACAIIAGGRARRMGGRVKALIEVEGKTILDRQRAALTGRVATVLIAANDARPYADTGLQVVPDRVPDKGPLAGLSAAMHMCSQPYLLALACDMPYFDGRLLELLCARRGPSVDIVVPVVGGRPEPLCALYARRLLPLVDMRLEQERLAANGLIREPGLAVVPIEESELRQLDPELRFLANLNTPGDVARS